MIHRGDSCRFAHERCATRTMKIRKGDQVKIISGNDRGKQGKVTAVFPTRHCVTVEGMNMKKKHMRPRQQGKKGELIKMSLPLQVSKVEIVCSHCGKATRVGYKTIDGNKRRICKKCQAEI